MKRLIIIYNPRSSRYKDVKNEVLDCLHDLKGYMIGKYEVEPTDVDKNAKKLSKIIKNGDIVLSVGGDATAVVALNGVMLSNADATVSVLPYGNFNDFARTLNTYKYKDVFKGKTEKYYPLEILVDGKHFRYASCYVTIGMTAEAVELFDKPNVRKSLQKGHKSSWRSYIYLASWYFKNRHKKKFIPEFKINGVLQNKKVSDYAAMNGTSMCRVMKGKGWFNDNKKFLRQVGKLTNFWNLFRLMSRSILIGVPGKTTDGDVLEFAKPATVELQAEGEYKVFSDIQKIEIRKADKCLKVIRN